MLRHAMVALAFAAAIGAGTAFAADEQKSAGDSRAAAGQRPMPVKLFEGREAGPNELFRVCLVDNGGGRLRRCGARD